MRQPSTTFAKIVLVAALVAAAALAGATGAGAYTVVTRDGHIIQSQARPEIRGLQAFMRLPPHGQLAVIQEEQIDWARTDAANPAPAQIAVPADVRMTDAPAADRQPGKEPGAPIELTIVGPPTAKEAGAAAPAEKTAEQKTPADGPPDPNKVNAHEALIKLQKEYAQVAAARDNAIERRKTLETEVAALQSRSVGYAGEESSAARRIRELQQQITSVNEEIAKCEARLSDIRAEAVQLGGSID